MLKDLVSKIEQSIGQFSRYACEFSGQRIAGESVAFDAKPAVQFLKGIGADPSKIKDPLPTLLSPLPNLGDGSINVNGVDVMSQARARRLRASAKIYLNPEIIGRATYEEALNRGLEAQTWEQAPSGIHYQNYAVGICHTQEIDLLVDHKMSGKEAVSTEKTAPICDDALPVLLLSSPALNFAYGLANQLTAEQKSIFIKGMYRNLFNATQAEGRTHIALPAAGLGVFGGDATVYFQALMAVAEEFPAVNVIYHPAQFGTDFDRVYVESHSPQNVVRATKDVIFIADALCKQGISCAFHNPSDADVVLGIYGPGEYWQTGHGDGYVGEEHIGAMTTAPLGGRGLNPEAYSRVVVMGAASDLLDVEAPVAEISDTSITVRRELFAKLQKSIQDLEDYSQSLLDKANASETEKAAGTSGFELAQRLKSKNISLDEFQDCLTEGYNQMSDNRRLGCFHSLLIAIFSVLSAIKACFVASDDQGPKAVEIGRTSQGFFSLTTRQKAVCKIQEALDVEKKDNQDNFSPIVVSPK